jgi:hypothetical protein
MRLARFIKLASMLAVGVVGSCASPTPAALNKGPRSEPVPRWQREPILAYVRTEVTPSSAPGLEPDWLEDILELRNATSLSFLFSTLFEDGFPGSVEPAASSDWERNSIGHCGYAMKSRTLPPGESFVMRAPCHSPGSSRAWMVVRDADTKAAITLVSDEYDSGADAPVVRTRRQK